MPRSVGDPSFNSLMRVVLVLRPKVATLSMLAHIEPKKAACDPLCGVPMKRMPLMF
jgi:3-deoxy-D-manno-octulosonic acid (KDO) 8-phosphate synthase